MLVAYFVIIITINFCQGNVTEKRLYDEHALCRQCGREITEFFWLKDITSPFAIKTRNITLLTDIRTPVQTLINPSGVLFDIITLEKSGCLPIGKWYTKDTWFPNYAWNVCVCPQCRGHLGWAFKKEDQTTTHPDFYALIEDNILRENFVDHLITVPKAYRI